MCKAVTGDHKSSTHWDVRGPVPPFLFLSTFKLQLRASCWPDSTRSWEVRESTNAATKAGLGSPQLQMENAR
jgi:hypothetical protein